MRDLTTLPNQKFVQARVTDPKRRVEIEIGDTKQAEWYPQAKMSYWGNEANFSVRLIDDQTGSVMLDAGRVKYVRPDREAHFYDLDDDHFEFEVLLKDRPRSNVLGFVIQSKGLDFHYQPELTAAEVAAGHQRPANVVGSYAVYHASRHGNYTDRHYRTGKAFHIYRPELIDAKGQRVWADLSIDVGAGLMTITMPGEWLDGAVYPVVVDPTFGQTSIGGSSSFKGAGSNLEAAKFTSPVDAGTLTSIHSAWASFTAADVRHAIYSDSSNAPNAKLAQDGAGIAISGTSPTWYQTAVSYAMSPSTAYWLSLWNSDTTSNNALYYDTGGGTNQRQSVTATYPTLPDPFSAAGAADHILSIYATYTAAASGRSMLLGGSLLGGGILLKGNVSK